MSNEEKLGGRSLRRRGHVALVLLIIVVSLLTALIPARANAQNSGSGSNKSTSEYNVSDRVFYMDRGEVWEAGPPKQIFENPQRPETYRFVFSVRSWEWELAYPDADHPAMVGSLSTFCTRQLVERRLADACLHVVEELATERLPAIASGIGASGMIAKLTLHMPEEGRKAQLEVDCHDLVECGANPKQLAHGHDPISDALIAGYSVLTTPKGDSANDPAIICYEIG